MPGSESNSLISKVPEIQAEPVTERSEATLSGEPPVKVPAICTSSAKCVLPETSIPFVPLSIILFLLSSVPIEPLWFIPFAPK